MRKKPWLYSAPALLLILTVVVFPIGYTAYISLTNMNLYHWADFRVIGLSNYVRALFKFDSGFLGALFTTLLWTVVNMALQLFCGFWIALGLNAKGLRLRRLYKTLLMLPWAMPAYVSIRCGGWGYSTPSLACSTSGSRRWGCRSTASWTTRSLPFWPALRSISGWRCPS